MIKATLNRLLESSDLESVLAHDLRFIRRRMDEITEITLSDDLVHRVKLTRTTRHYGLLMKICQLPHDHFLVGEGAHDGNFHHLLKEELKMHVIFQSSSGISMP
jgi:5-methylcytosine-specific restriction endonuclease McrBC regulatory subunit McrC